MDAAGTSRWIGSDSVGSDSLGSDSVRSERAFQPARLLRTAAMLAMLMLALAGMLLVARRMSGALMAPLSIAALAGAGVLLAVVGLGFRRVLAEVALTARVRLAIFALPGVVSLLWLAALSLPETSGWGLMLLFGPVLLAEGWSWERFAAHEPANPAVPDAASADLLMPSPAAASAALEKGLADEARPDGEPAEEEFAGDGFSEEPAERDADAIQQQTRRRDAEAGEVVEGWVRVDFVAGQRHAVAHVAICPPLSNDPTCYAEPGDGPDASVKVTQAMSYGVRLEVKLAEPAAEAASVIVEYSILQQAAGGE